MDYEKCHHEAKNIVIMQKKMVDSFKMCAVYYRGIEISFWRRAVEIYTIYCIAIIEMLMFHLRVDAELLSVCELVP
jgi:hypothetical protein